MSLEGRPDPRRPDRSQRNLHSDEVGDGIHCGVREDFVDDWLPTLDMDIVLKVAENNTINY